MTSRISIKNNSRINYEKSLSESNRVREHYERWPFPDKDFLSREGLLLLRNLSQWLEEEVPVEKRSQRVIEIGSGTGNSIIAVARNFPGIQFLGMDISKTSIELANLKARREKVPNVKFQRLDLMKSDLSSLGQFKVVLCTGVLHHIKNMNKAFKQVVQLIKGDGYLILWLYGRYGRSKHNLNQSFLKLLTKKVSRSEALSVAQAFLESLGPRFAVNSGFYTPKGSSQDGIAWLLKHPQWIADQMIPAFEQSVTMKEILNLFEEHHLEFNKWLGVPLHLKNYTSSKRLLECFEKLSFQERLLAIDHLLKPEYYFVVGKKASSIEKFR
jgi:2-polyprenyl-3-methyl-5-hydroxy-6-metoxy-1,4-benzoquinol methylase